MVNPKSQPFQNPHWKEINRRGFFECDRCTRKWKSAKVVGVFVSGNFKVSSGQACENHPDNFMFPYKTESLSEEDEEVKKQTDPSKQHRRELCQLCKDKGYCPIAAAEADYTPFDLSKAAGQSVGKSSKPATVNGQYIFTNSKLRSPASLQSSRSSSSKSKTRRKSGTAKARLKSGTNEIGLSSHTVKPTLKSETAQSSLKSCLKLDINQSRHRTGTPKSILKTGTNEQSVRTSSNQPSVRTGTNQYSIRTGTIQPSLRLGTTQSQLTSKSNTTQYQQHTRTTPQTASYHNTSFNERYPISNVSLARPSSYLAYSSTEQSRDSVNNIGVAIPYRAPTISHHHTVPNLATPSTERRRKGHKCCTIM